MAASPYSIYVHDGGRPVRIWHFIVPILAAGGWLVFLVFAAPWAVAIARNAGLTDRDLFDVLHSPEAAYPGIQFLLVTVYLVILIALRICVGRAGNARLVADYLPVRGKWIGVGALVGVTLAVAVLAVIGVLSETGVVEFRDDQTQRAIMPTSLTQLGIAVVGMVIMGPYVEELYFRGALLTWLRERLGWLLALFASAAVFGLIHLEFLIFPGVQGWVITGLIGAVGVVNGMWAYATRSLWPAFATHAAYNATLVSLAFLFPEAQT